jgi:hypothetical protein
VVMKLYKHIIEDVVCGEDVDHVDYWTPIEPQPMCTNCKHSREKHYIGGEKLVCGKIGNNYDALIIPEYDFYCKYWEKK